MTDSETIDKNPKLSPRRHRQMVSSKLKEANLSMSPDEFKYAEQNNEQLKRYILPMKTMQRSVKYVKTKGKTYLKQ